MGGSDPLHAEIPPEQTPPPPEQTPPGPDTPSRADTPPGPGTPPGAVHAGRYGQQAGGTHPTGMQSSSDLFSVFLAPSTIVQSHFTFLVEFGKIMVHRTRFI